MGETDSRILEALLKADDEGVVLDLEDLQRRFPGREKQIERILRAKERYAQGLAQSVSLDVSPEERGGAALAGEENRPRQAFSQGINSATSWWSVSSDRAAWGRCFSRVSSPLVIVRLP